MTTVVINQTDFLINIIIPFFDRLSKKQKDYSDWKSILYLIKQGKHFHEEGKQVINLLISRINNNRLSTYSSYLYIDNYSIDLRTSLLLNSPSNYEIKPSGKILIKSSGSYLEVMLL